jgi:hypothetical protein
MYFPRNILLVFKPVYTQAPLPSVGQINIKLGFGIFISGVTILMGLKNFYAFSFESLTNIVCIFTFPRTCTFSLNINAIARHNFLR